LKKWYLEQSIPLFSEINNYVRNDFLVHNIRVPETTITVKEMKTRWGSCNPVKAKISMNLKLMEYPKECIYSVFYHEYSHFIHQNHSPEFYKLLLELCPDYKKWDTVLKK
jgi:hypothetical protein